MSKKIPCTAAELWAKRIERFDARREPWSTSFVVNMDFVYRTARSMQHATAGCERFAHMIGESRCHFLSSYCTDACRSAASEDIVFVESWLLRPVLKKRIDEVRR